MVAEGPVLFPAARAECVGALSMWRGSHPPRGPRQQTVGLSQSVGLLNERGTGRAHHLSPTQVLPDPDRALHLKFGAPQLARPVQEN